MDDWMIQSYIWKELVYKAFHPVSRTDKKRWLIQYGHSLYEFWGLSAPPDNPVDQSGKLTGRVSAPSKFLLDYEYQIDSENKFSVRVRYLASSETVTLFVHDVDNSYFFIPVHNFASTNIKTDVAINEFKEHHIETVVDGMLVHPAVHQHIVLPIDFHEIRIGGGINNPFQYLFHLRYQLCPNETRKKEEKSRLIDLFAAAIRRREDQVQISPRELMAAI